MGRRSSADARSFPQMPPVLPLQPQKDCGGEDFKSRAEQGGDGRVSGSQAAQQDLWRYSMLYGQHSKYLY